MAGTTKLTGEKAAIKIKVDATTTNVAKMENWKLSIKANEVETTSFDDDGWETYEISTKGWELSMEGTYKKDDPGQKAIKNAIAKGLDIEVELFTNKEDVEPDFSGKIKVTGLDPDTSVKDKIKLSIKAKGNGKLNGLEDATV